MSRAWFAYIGAGNPILPENYVLSTAAPACRNGFAICAIYASDEAGETPSVISANIRRYIANGLTNGVSQPSIPGAAKKYVYMKASG